MVPGWSQPSRPVQRPVFDCPPQYIMAVGEWHFELCAAVCLCVPCTVGWGLVNVGLLKQLVLSLLKNTQKSRLVINPLLFLPSYLPNTPFSAILVKSGTNLLHFSLLSLTVLLCTVDSSSRCSDLPQGHHRRDQDRPQGLLLRARYQGQELLPLVQERRGAVLMDARDLLPIPSYGCLQPH